VYDPSILHRKVNVYKADILEEERNKVNKKFVLTFHHKNSLTNFSQINCSAQITSLTELLEHLTTPRCKKSAHGGEFKIYGTKVRELSFYTDYVAKMNGHGSLAYDKSSFSLK
jgi:hypothetical protein